MTEVRDNKTYKLRTPHVEEAVYLTIIDDENGNPIQMLINSKNMTNYQWIEALMRFVSLALVNGDIKKVIAELKTTFDPHHGGYVKPGTDQWVNSFINHIGDTLEKHWKEKEE